MPRKTLASERDMQEIVERLKKVEPSSQRRWGKMTAHQMLCHLSDSFRGPMGVRPMTQVKSAGPRWLIKWIALDSPLPWPKGVKTRPESDQLIGGTPPVEFEADRAKLLALLDRFTRKPRDFAWQPHPIFGEMAEKDWMRWGYLHMNHHLSQFGA